jgi:hypothetical protein
VPHRVHCWGECRGAVRDHDSIVSQINELGLAQSGILVRPTPRNVLRLLFSPVYLPLSHSLTDLEDIVRLTSLNPLTDSCESRFDGLAQTHTGGRPHLVGKEGPGDASDLPHRQSSEGHSNA